MARSTKKDSELENQELEDQGSENQTPENQTPENQAPENQTPENQAPENQTPENQAPENQAPGNQKPENQGSENQTPEDQDHDDQNMPDYDNKVRISQVYVGPSLPDGLLNHGAIFCGTERSNMEYLEDVLRQYPQVKHLLTKIEKLPSAKAQVKKPGTLLYRYAQDVTAEIRARK